MIERPAGRHTRSINHPINMKTPTDQDDRNEDKKKPETENPSHGIDPESEEPEREATR